MVEIPVLLLLIALLGLALIAGYSIGHKEGHGEGYVRGRAIAKALRESEISK
jgi:hypothetical protein